LSFSAGGLKELEHKSSERAQQLVIRKKIARCNQGYLQLELKRKQGEIKKTWSRDGGVLQKGKWPAMKNWLSDRIEPERRNEKHSTRE